jgi:IMP dehydrogenase
MARLGGIGIIHKNMSIKEQVRQCLKVKKSESGMILDPITIKKHQLIQDAEDIMANYKISGVPVIDNDGVLIGILTNRDMRFTKDFSKQVYEKMTKMPLITAKKGTTLDEASLIMNENKIEKLPIIDKENKLIGLITIKDINKNRKYPNSNKDKYGRLVVGAAIGVNQIDRAIALSEAGVDVLVLDSAHGHSKGIIDTLKTIKKTLDIEVIAGNIATAEGAKDLIKAGADGIKVGIGPGSICTTRIVSGVGVPQVSALSNCYNEAKKHNVPVIADGGIRYSGDCAKAIAIGASCVMMGSVLAGTQETPGEIVLSKGRRYKSYRGMGSIGAMKNGSKDRYFQDGEKSDKLVPEGIEGLVPFRGEIGDIIHQFCGGLRASMGYLGSKDINTFTKNAVFVQITSAGLKESHVHDVSITNEAPNYHL